MLTRRQHWRRVGPGIQRNPERDERYKLKVTGNTTSTQQTHLPPCSCSLESVEKRSNKKLRFNNSVRVILIPTRDEYRDAHLNNALWWTEDDYFVFKKQAAQELRTLMQLLNIDCKAAMRMVYQVDQEASTKSKVPHLVKMPAEIDDILVKTVAQTHSTVVIDNLCHQESIDSPKIVAHEKVGATLVLAFEPAREFEWVGTNDEMSPLESNCRFSYKPVSNNSNRVNLEQSISPTCAAISFRGDATANTAIDRMDEILTSWIEPQKNSSGVNDLYENDSVPCSSTSSSDLANSKLPNVQPNQGNEMSPGESLSMIAQAVDIQDLRRKFDFQVSTKYNHSDVSSYQFGSLFGRSNRRHLVKTKDQLIMPPALPFRKSSFRTNVSDQHPPKPILRRAVSAPEDRQDVTSNCEDINDLLIRSNSRQGTSICGDLAVSHRYEDAYVKSMDWGQSSLNRVGLHQLAHLCT